MELNENPFAEFVPRYYHDPVLMVEEVLGMDGRDAQHTIDPKQRELLEAVARGERRVSVRSGHGVGKTASLAWLIIWFILTRYPQKTIATAPTASQLFDALAAEVKVWIGKLPKPLQEILEIKSERIELKRDPAASFIAFNTSRAETPEALQGKHSDNVLLIADEASGVPDPVFEASSGSMAGPNRQMVLAGNPVRSSGLFWQTFNDEEVSPQWYKIHISAVGHPRIPQDFITDMASRYGENSNAFRVRVLGEFPLADDDTVIPFELAESAMNRDVQPINVQPIWGVDVAGGGKNKSTLAKRKGNVLLEPVKKWQGLGTMELVGRIKEQWDTTPLDYRPSAICIDSIGIGAGVADRLREMGLPSLSINVGETAAMRDRFANLKAELWWTVREWFEKRDVNISRDKVLRDQLILLRVKPTVTNKIGVETKIQLKQRGKDSPDEAEAFVLTFAVPAMQAGGHNTRQSWNKPLKRIIPGLP
jgi:phage terminase large subunit